MTSSLFYYFYIILLLAPIAFYLDKIKQHNTLLFTFFISCLSIYFGLRYGVGHDYYNYLINYTFIERDESYNNPVFLLLNQAYSFLSLPFPFVTITCCFFIYYLIFSKLYNDKKLFLGFIFSLLSGFIFFTNNQIKQGLAAAIFIYSIRFIVNKELIKYFISIIFASIAFHYSALLLLVLYFIPNIKIKTPILLLLYLIAFYLVKNDLISSIYIEALKSIPIYGEKYNDRIILNLQSVASGLSLIYLIILGTITNYLNKDIIPNKIVNLYTLGILVNVLFINSEFIERVSFYLIYISFIIYPYLLKNINKNPILFSIIIFLLLTNYIFDAGFGYGKHGATGFTWYYSQ